MQREGARCTMQQLGCLEGLVWYSFDNLALWHPTLLGQAGVDVRQYRLQPLMSQAYAPSLPNGNCAVAAVGSSAEGSARALDDRYRMCLRGRNCRQL